VDEFSFEELIADMLDITDEQREDDEVIFDKFFEKFGFDIEQGFTFAKALLPHTPKVQAGLSGKVFHTFLSKGMPVMLMKLEAKDT
jgi:hypothetical protein